MKSMCLQAIVLASLLVGLAPSTRAADDLSVVQQRVAQVEVLRGGFEQEKRIAGFKNPLRSQGSFLVARGKGVVWTTLKPFPSEVVITGDRILSRQRDGSTRVEVDGREQPALRSVNAMMFALVSGDVAALSSRFDTQVQARAGNAWTLALTPKSAALAKAFRRITLNGDRYVRDVDIEEANGDHTHLRFVDLSQTPAQLSVDEARRFD
ncbi:LolA family protein [Pseudoxanthomonas indica]|uniref:Outer membrane lipoprotein carrier protein LolA n=1 Tax=Pseudoxanthomonas indica TaxID=428993 RepID=A0A1T5IMU6_9GAMM|nr:outer membrane lipoprotein carrier protein LolA [Pseudoxanthomonas indica]SKC40283.1 Outer membrane lipoprotein carrier protein LolA [Pseudoxanthomonas indica]